MSKKPNTDLVYPTKEGGRLNMNIVKEGKITKAEMSYNAVWHARNILDDWLRQNSCECIRHDYDMPENTKAQSDNG